MVPCTHDVRDDIGKHLALFIWHKTLLISVILLCHGMVALIAYSTRTMTGKPGEGFQTCGWLVWAISQHDVHHTNTGRNEPVT